MHALSWMIYAADISDRLSMTSLSMAIICGLAAAGAALLAMVAEADEDWSLMQARMASLARGLTIAAIALTPVAIFTPSRSALYVIAASEAAARSEMLAKAGGLADPMIDLLRKKIEDALKAKTTPARCAP